MANKHFFSNFDIIPYDYTIRGKDTVPIIENIVNLTQRTQLSISDDDLKNLTIEYLIPTGIKPEQIASKLYNDPQLHWTILYINDITDITTQWPINESALYAFVTKKYGAGNENLTHHYEKMPERITIDPTFCYSTYGQVARIVTNYDYETDLNESKRFIKAINPLYIASFVQMWQAAQVK